MRIAPFALMHILCVLVVFVGFSWPAVVLTGALYCIRMFAITGWYHRYFAHRSFKTSRAFQFVWGFIGCCAIQKGPLWWAAHHRNHHRFSDQPEDTHSPRQSGFIYSHMGWFLTRKNFETRHHHIRDFTRYPELRFLNRFDLLPPVLLGFALYGLGELIAAQAPGWGATGWQFVVWGILVSTVICYHATYTINSLSHVFGSQRFRTGDDSRNNFWLALLTFGEGWHNNHHHYQSAVRQGFYWWEIDLTWYVLKMMSWVGLVWDLRPVPRAVKDGANAA
ncbi:MAG: acyl-CoA desaturase [Planctomycetes bacterium]|nr:acyl-CoA desaturase [Planctomycetota bacterium]